MYVVVVNCSLLCVSVDVGLMYFEKCVIMLCIMYACIRAFVFMFHNLLLQFLSEIFFFSFCAFIMYFSILAIDVFLLLHFTVTDDDLEGRNV